MTEAYVYDAVRTPFGRFGGALAGVRPDDLAATVLRGLLSRNPSLPPDAVDEVVLGNANGAGEENRNVARMATLLAGLPVSVPGTTVNRLCGSSLDAAIVASRQIECGDASIVLTGGVESMSRAPWVLPKPSRAYPAGDVQAVSTTLGWRLVNPRMPAEWTVSLGEANEQLADRFGVARDRQDAFALRSHQNAARAWAEGFYDDLVCTVPDLALGRDEGIRTDASLDALSSLSPSFRPEGTITAGNASPLSDGAAAVLLGDAGAAELIGREPQARIAGRGSFALTPQDFGLAPVGAVERAMKAAGIGWSDVDLVELNEAFAAQSLVCTDQWDVDPERVNPYGGAIALGHPLGASGARLLGTLVAGLRQRGGRFGVAALCIGVGQALAVVVENLSSGRP
jgi:acetyl-CoA acyltransferase